MSLGPRLSISIKKLIYTEARRLRDIPRYALAVRLQKMIEEMLEPVPRIETIEKLISKARQYSGSKLDKEWDIASLIEEDLPADSLPSVINVWRYAISTHELYTIRQSKWVARLHVFIEDISLLWFWSRKYSTEEAISEAIGSKPDTFIPDSALFFNKWETKTLLLTDYRKSKLIKYKYDQIIFKTKDGHIAEEVLHGIEHPGLQFQKNIDNQRDEELTFKICELPSLESLSFNFETRLVYLRWFTYITKGPNWKQLSAKEVLDIIKQLRQWVLSKQDEMLHIEAIDTTKTDNINGFGDFASDLKPVMPSELLAKVGYHTYTGGEK